MGTRRVLPRVRLAKGAEDVAQAALDDNTIVFPLNYSLAKLARKSIACYTIRGNQPAENFDVSNEKDWTPGVAELLGMSHTASILTEVLNENPNAVAVVAVTKNRRAALLLLWFVRMRGCYVPDAFFERNHNWLAGCASRFRALAAD